MALVMAFTAQDAARLAGVSVRRLRYWEETGVYQPSYVDDQPHRPFRRIYDFRDIVSLRTLAVLRNEHHIPLDELRRAGEYLQRFSNYPWLDLRFGVSGQHLAIFDPESQEWVAARPLGQRFILEVDRIRRAAERDAKQLLARKEDDIGRVTRNRYVLSNAWVLAGTRVPTAAVWRLHEAGYSDDEIIKKYPRLTPQDIVAALRHEETLRAEAA